ncbi:MAG: flagellar motor protein MotB [Candidatus Omnitrophota bacterium]
MRKQIPVIGVVLLLTLSMVTSGCTFIFQKGRKKDVETITQLQKQNTQLRNKMTDLERAQQELQSRLKGEIADRNVKVEMMDRGLVITFLAEVLFNSGKAVLRDEALSTLDKVARVLKTTVEQMRVGVEGHTDNVPITHSKWESNWELSTARALSVLHYLVGEHTIDPHRLSATGYGEYHPVASNATPEGRQKNRRVEIVILPPTEKKPAEAVKSENLK